MLKEKLWDSSNEKEKSIISKFTSIIKLLLFGETDFNPRMSSLRIVIIYILMGALWILFSDRLVAGMFNNKDIIVLVSIIKGWFYVISTGLIIYILIIRRMYKIEKTQRELSDSKEKLKFQLDELQNNRNELKRLHERYELAIDGSNDCIWDWDIINDISYMSLKWVELLGLESQKLNNHDEVWRGLIHPEDVFEASNNVRAHLDSDKEYYTNEYRIRKRTGGYIWITSRAKILRDANGKAIRMAGSYTDISKNKQMLQSIKESESKYRVLFDNMALGHARFKITFDENGMPAYLASEVNNSFEEITGIKREDAIGRHITDVFSDESLERFDWTETFNAGGSFDIPLHIDYYSDKFSKWLSLIVYRLDEGNIACIISDISERKNSEGKMRSVVSQLTQLEKLINITSELVYISDFNGMYKYSNPSMEAVYGYSKQEFIQMNIFDLDNIIHPEEIENYNNAMENVRRKGEGVISFETRYKCKSGIYKWISWKLNPDKYNGLIYGVGHDITEEKDNLNQIKDLNSELEERVEIRTKQLLDANKELEAFNYSISHDLRAPLRSIFGFSSILFESCKEQLDQDIIHYLDRILDSAKRMNIMIDDLLNLSKLGKGELVREKFNLSDLVRNIFDQICKLQPQRQIEVVIAEGVYTFAEKSLVQIVLENLIGNAWKFTGRHPTARIEFGTIEKDHVVAYFIKDDGAGFDMGYSDKLFGTFQRLHSSKEFEGNGIGLANVQRIVKRHGGLIWAESEIEKGAVFYFTLGE